MYLGHISDDRLREQPLSEHLCQTAELARKFADVFHAGDWGYLCGILHDIGKYSEEFQQRIRGKNIKVDHSAAGAKEAQRSGAFFAAYCIAGHHAGLPDGMYVGGAASEESTLDSRLKRSVPDYQAYKKEISVSRPASLALKTDHGKFCMSFFIRMIYSCLVDADYLDTEAFMKDRKRELPDVSMQELKKRLDRWIEPWLAAGTDAPADSAGLAGGQERQPASKSLNVRRTNILKACIRGGSGGQGIYHLTVPTGGGKTASSMAFALNHAVEHGLRRIIYVIPYTSIIEQNADVFRKMLGDEYVLEDHSNVEYPDKEELDPKQLAAENWDMPVVVTTNVQFFESLFASRSSKCRKLHNIAGSVLIFDEAQMLPNDYLKPCLQAISELVLNYGCTAVLCTATQPSLQPFFSSKLLRGELCPNVEEQYEAFRRTVLVKDEDMTEEELVRRLGAESQVLCILNTRAQVQKIYEKMEEREGLFHLSTYMYPEHRRVVLAKIRERLKSQKVCRVIATSLVEAGVDLDFQTVYREAAGLDSVIQAAGRCNREGRRAADDSRTHVFQFIQEERHRNLSVRQEKEIAEEIMAAYEKMDSLEAIHEYFDRLHDVKGDSLDKKKILQRLNEAGAAAIPFRTIADDFKIIRDDTRSILITREPEAKQLEERLRFGERNRKLMRAVGRYSVNVYKNTYDDLRNAGLLEEIDERIAILTDVDRYSEETGLNANVSLGEGVFF